MPDRPYEWQPVAKGFAAMLTLLGQPNAAAKQVLRHDGVPNMVLFDSYMRLKELLAAERELDEIKEQQQRDAQTAPATVHQAGTDDNDEQPSGVPQEAEVNLTSSASSTVGVQLARMTEEFFRWREQATDAQAQLRALRANHDTAIAETEAGAMADAARVKDEVEQKLSSEEKAMSFRLDAANAEIETLRTQLREVQSSVETEVYKGIHTETKRVWAENENVRKDRDAAQKERDKLSDDKDKAQHAHEKEVARLETKHQDTISRLKREHQDRLDEVKELLETTQTDKWEAQADKADAAKSRDAERREKEKERSEKDKERGERDKERAEKEKERSEKEKAQNEAKASKETEQRTQKALDAANQRALTLEGELQAAKSDIKAAEKRANDSAATARERIQGLETDVAQLRARLEADDAAAKTAKTAAAKAGELVESFRQAREDEASTATQLSDGIKAISESTKLIQGKVDALDEAKLGEKLDGIANVVKSVDSVVEGLQQLKLNEKVAAVGADLAETLDELAKTVGDVKTTAQGIASGVDSVKSAVDERLDVKLSEHLDVKLSERLDVPVSSVKPASDERLGTVLADVTAIKDNVATFGDLGGSVAWLHLTADRIKRRVDALTAAIDERLDVRVSSTRPPPDARLTAIATDVTAVRAKVDANLDAQVSLAATAAALGNVKTTVDTAADGVSAVKAKVDQRLDVNLGDVGRSIVRRLNEHLDVDCAPRPVLGLGRNVATDLRDVKAKLDLRLDAKVSSVKPPTDGRIGDMAAAVSRIDATVSTQLDAKVSSAGELGTLATDVGELKTAVKSIKGEVQGQAALQLSLGPALASLRPLHKPPLQHPAPVAAALLAASQLVTALLERTLMRPPYGFDAWLTAVVASRAQPDPNQPLPFASNVHAESNSALSQLVLAVEELVNADGTREACASLAAPLAAIASIRESLQATDAAAKEMGQAFRDLVAHYRKSVEGKEWATHARRAGVAQIERPTTGATREALRSPTPAATEKQLLTLALAHISSAAPLIHPLASDEWPQPAALPVSGRLQLVELGHIDAPAGAPRISWSASILTRRLLAGIMPCPAALVPSDGSPAHPVVWVIWRVDSDEAVIWSRPLLFTGGLKVPEEFEDHVRVKLKALLGVSAVAPAMTLVMQPPPLVLLARLGAASPEHAIDWLSRLGGQE